MDVMFVAQCAAAGAVAAGAASALELWQDSKKLGRWPWRSKTDSPADTTYNTLSFWLLSNIALRLTVAIMFCGLQAAAGWFASVGAAIVMGAGTSFALGGAASNQDVGYAPLPPPNPARAITSDPAGS
ncbi:hypothetical protein [Nocardia sp. NPDC058705]|uniref:hypothetical protein n=1 Tax=Nocardia sp. NPDC058705 TaxID=3346609 RepID=UPI0036BA939B